ncbi:MAG TPA: hypothetical protein ENI97_07850, partial [Gammaproteobacteria bacterium]|nr:hypothetical protein [Gammaproteobacteria bacterium]
MGHLTSTPNNTRHDLSISILLTALLTLTWLIYQPAIPGFFMLDDFDNLAALKGGVHDIPTLKDFLETGKAGKLGRPIAKLTFLINDNAWPSNPESFKQTNLLIHLLIGVILFCFARLALQPFMLRKQGDWVALIATGIWLVHPFHVSTVSYIVQRMAQLSSLFIIIAASIHLYMRLKYPALYTRHLIWLSISLVIIGSLAAFSKENGVLLPIYILVIEFTILSSNLPSRNFIWWRRVFIILPSIVLLSYIAYIPRWIGSYASRDFTLGERLLTEPVILLDYLTRFFTVRVHKLGLFQDDYPIYHNLLDVRALGSLLLILIVISSAVCFRKKYPIYAFGVLWFFAGHILESTTVSLELYFEHRNYLPLFGPVLAFTALFYLGIKRFSKDLSRVSPIFGALIISIASLTTWGYANEWGNPLRLFPIWSVEHPESPRAQRTYAHILASEGLPNAALDVLDSAYDQFPYDLSIPLMSINISCSFGSPLRYDLKSLALQIERYRITDGLRPALESLFE